MEKLTNPFVVGRYVSGEYFCDREKETESLIRHIENGRNVVLSSPRRIGKTELINHCFSQSRLKDNYYTFFVDIYATASLPEFVYLLGKTIYEELKPKRTVWAERFFQAVGSLRIGVKLDALTGEPRLEMGLGDIQAPQTTLDEIFAYLESADKPCIIAIDEFQQIGAYQEKNVEAVLRTKIQQCKQTFFIFSGSKRHVMNIMFNSPSKPFYLSAVGMGLEAIPLENYTDFACGLFERWGKRVERNLVEKVWRRFDGCTWFVQMMMNELFALTPDNGCCGVDKFETAWENIISVQEWSYKDLLAHLSSKQKQVLQAIAKEGQVSGITSAAFIKRHNLASASSVQSAIKPLLHNDLITQSGDTYRVYDHFFAEWLRREY